MRVFAAVPLTSAARLGVSAAVEGLHMPGRVVPPENWHITLRYLGWVDDVAYERFLHGLAAVADRRRFRIRLDGVGAFPNARRATVVWVGVGAGVAELSELAAAAEDAAVAAGLNAEERPFRPHLTLSRVRPPADVTAILGVEVAVSWRCDGIVVYRSVTGRDGSRYEPLESFRFKV